MGAAHQVADKDEAVVVLDYTSAASTKSTRMASCRPATGGRGLRVGGTVYSELTPRVKCLDCGGWADGNLIQGRHAPRGLDGRVVNCRLKEIHPWP